MRKILAVLLVVILLVCFAGCKNRPAESSSCVSDISNMDKTDISSTENSDSGISSEIISSEISSEASSSENKNSFVSESSSSDVSSEVFEGVNPLESFLKPEDQNMYRMLDDEKWIFKGDKMYLVLIGFSKGEKCYISVEEYVTTNETNNTSFHNGKYYKFSQRKSFNYYYRLTSTEILLSELFEIKINITMLSEKQLKITNCKNELLNQILPKDAVFVLNNQ